MPDEITRSLELVLRAQQGDREALNRLFQRYYDRVRAIVRLRLGMKLRERVDSSDIAQEAFVAALLSFESFEMREPASFIQWLSRIVERQIMAAADYHGAKKRDHRREMPLPAHNGEAGTATVPFDLEDGDGLRPIDIVGDSEERARVEGCIERLPEEYRELILLRDYAGASWEAVAEETGRPTAAAARMMHARAMIELGQCLRRSETARSSDSA
jgi:RNA polymerase sigma-70 factor (ECF subfamily)